MISLKFVSLTFTQLGFVSKHHMQFGLFDVWEWNWEKHEHAFGGGGSRNREKIKTME
jgi:hypothetical protein